MDIAVEKPSDAVTLQEEVGAKIRSVRRARGWTLGRLGQAIGTTPQTAQRLEAGTMTMSMHWLERIAKALGVEPYELLAKDDVIHARILVETKLLTLQTAFASFTKAIASSYEKELQPCLPTQPLTPPKPKRRRKTQPTASPLSG